LHPKKRTKVEELSTVTIAYMKNKRPDQAGEKQKLRVLFDSGCGATLVNKRFVRHWKKTESKATKWSTKGGSFKTKRKCEIEFTLPAFNENRNITCKAYVDESNHESSNSDIIIGRDLLHSLGTNLLFDTAEIAWDNAKIRMQPPGKPDGEWLDSMEQELLYAHDPTTTDSYEVLRKMNNSEWACPMFTIAKPDGSLRSLADLREVNKVIQRKPYPLPRISDMLQKLEGFMYATSLDLNMGYYHMLLTPFARRLCTIVLPWAKYKYFRLPMGLYQSVQTSFKKR
jgi:hypothetical protein